jgi:GDP-mannose 6-dehydrogenase
LAAFSRLSSPSCRGNESHLEACIERALATDVKQIGPFGVTFKEGTDDLRESPVVELAERLIPF